jgi:hypothetical protein
MSTFTADTIAFLLNTHRDLPTWRCEFEIADCDPDAPCAGCLDLLAREGTDNEN